MKSIQTLTLSKKKYSFNILDSIHLNVEVTDNPYNLPLHDLFTMAARINKKRSFLFVSKLIGKHLPIKPQKGLLTSALLAMRYYELIKKGECEFKSKWISSFFLNVTSFKSTSFIPSDVQPLIIGFAETATALGHAFFDCFMEADYFHTTRELLSDLTPSIIFEEEHSHATSHRCYIPLERIHNNREIILVDDELTTGKTALNIIRSIHSSYPRNEYTVVSILDWRSQEYKLKFKQLEEELGIKINVVSLIAGTFRVKQNKQLEKHKTIADQTLKKETLIEYIHLPISFSQIHMHSVLENGSNQLKTFIKETGRFGINREGNNMFQQQMTKIGSFLAEKRSGTKTLCLGTGEFMYLPMKIAAEMGEGIFYQSTTRSPIFIQNVRNYGAKYGLAFPNPEDMNISHFVYNIPPGYYDDVFIFFESKMAYTNFLPLLKQMEQTQVRSIKVVYFTE